MVYHPLHHSRIFKFILTQQLSEVYLMIAIRSFALSMIGIFVPLFFYRELNFTLQQISYFYILFFSFFIFFSLISAKISHFKGTKHSMLLSSFFLVFAYSLLYLMKNLNIPLWLIAFIFSIGSSLFWINFHINFVKVSHKRKEGEEVSKWYSLSIIFSIIGPLIGGLIINYFGFMFLFVLSNFLLILSTIPLFFSSEIYEKNKFFINKFFKFPFNKKRFKDLLAFFGYGVRNGIAVVAWPIFIFLAVKKYVSFGYIFSFASLFNALFVLWIGKLSDFWSNKKLINFGSILNSFTWFFRIMAINLWHFFIVSFFASLSFTMVDVPFSSLVYNKARKLGKISEYVVFREIGLFLGRVFSLSLIFLFNNFLIYFIVAGLFSLLAMCIEER